MSSHDAIHRKAAAKFKELHASYGKPTKLDNAFLKEYFSVFSDKHKHQPEHAHPYDSIADAHLGKSAEAGVTGTGTELLLNVQIDRLKRRFVANLGSHAEPLKGATVIMVDDVKDLVGEGNYGLFNLEGDYVRIYIHYGEQHVAEFVSFTPQKVNVETGEGKWETIN